MENGPATFAAIAVLDRVLEKAKSDKTWLVMLDRVATAQLSPTPTLNCPWWLRPRCTLKHTCSPRRSPARAIFSPLQELAFSAPSSSILMSSN